MKLSISKKLTLKIEKRKALFYEKRGQHPRNAEVEKSTKHMLMELIMVMSPHEVKVTTNSQKYEQNGC